MYKCRDCGQVFEEPARTVDKVEFWGMEVEMESFSCPCCEGDDYDEEEVVNAEEEQDEEQLNKWEEER